MALTCGAWTCSGLNWATCGWGLRTDGVSFPPLGLNWPKSQSPFLSAFSRPPGPQHPGLMSTQR